MKILTLLSLCFFIISVQAGTTKAIYGSDNRMEAQETIFFNFARSTAAMIPADDLKIRFSLKDFFHYRALGKSLEETGVPVGFFGVGEVCPDVRFRTQPRSAICSGFLVGPDLLVTAGHCMVSQEMCDNFRWGFDYFQRPDNKAILKIKNVYKCKEIVSQKMVEPKLLVEGPYGGFGAYYDTFNLDDYDHTDAIDYAIIRLNRKVKNREPLRLRRFGQARIGTNLVVIGNPMGLSTKVAGGARITRNDFPHSFVTDLDTFSGNSGSAVIDAETGVVEGILVSGEKDFEKDPERGCYREKVCFADDCRGETVTRITSLMELEDLLDWW